MSWYRRAIIPGGTFFFTVVAWQRRPILCQPDFRAALRAAIRTVRAETPFTIDGWVLLPDHLHCIWTLPRDDSDYSSRWARIKRQVTKTCGNKYQAAEQASVAVRSRNESTIWQRRFIEHAIRNDGDLRRHLDYIHWNRVKHGHVMRAADWPYSTLHR